MYTSVYRKAHFNAAHRLHNQDWSDEKNKEIFGLCNNEYYHGHNYELEVRVGGMVDENTGYLIDLKILSEIIKHKIENSITNLNLQVEEFKTLNPTAENICKVIYTILKENLDDKYDIGVRLYETPRNFVEIDDAFQSKQTTGLIYLIIFCTGPTDLIQYPFRTILYNKNEHYLGLTHNNQQDIFCRYLV